MALQVKPTPKVKGKEGRELLRKLEEGITRGARLTPTPKLGEAAELVRRLFAGCTRNGR
jgi:hypothetical protein